MGSLTAEELNAAATLAEFVNVRKQDDFNDDRDFATHAVHGVEDGQPTGEDGAAGRWDGRARA